MLLGPPVPSLDQVPRDIDAQHVGTEFCLGLSRSDIAATEIQYFKSFGDSESLHERLAAFAHRISDAREIAFFPECFVWICRSIHNVKLSVGFG